MYPHTLDLHYTMVDKFPGVLHIHWYILYCVVIGGELIKPEI